MKSAMARHILVKQKRDAEEILEKLKQNPDFQNSKMLMVTANLSDNVYNKSITNGCDGFISKPIIIPDFIKIMNRCISELEI